MGSEQSWCHQSRPTQSTQSTRPDGKAKTEMTPNPLGSVADFGAWPELDTWHTSLATSSCRQRTTHLSTEITKAMDDVMFGEAPPSSHRNANPSSPWVHQKAQTCVLSPPSPPLPLGRPPSPPLPFGQQPPPYHDLKDSTSASASAFGSTVDFRWPRMDASAVRCTCLRRRMYDGTISTATADSLIRSVWFESGYGQLGKHIVSDRDLEYAFKCSADLLFGEFTPTGAQKALDISHLAANLNRGGVLLDLGSGLGKFAFQAFCQCSELRLVVGVELCESRAVQSFRALHNMQLAFEQLTACSCSTKGHESAVHYTVTTTKGITSLQLEGDSGVRQLEFRCENLLSFSPAFYAQANVVVMATQFPLHVLCQLADRVLKHLRPGTRLLTYQSLFPFVYSTRHNCPFTQIAISSTFETSWNPRHSYYLWRKNLCK